MFIKKAIEKGILYRKNQIFSLIFLSLLLIQFTNNVGAHPPSNIQLNYDKNTNTLTVEVSHSVSDPNSHYIEEISIKKNNLDYLTEQYSSQQSTSSFTASYIVNATEDDVLEVTAVCNIAGQISKSIIIESNGSSSTSTPGFEIIFILLAFLIALILINRKKKFKN